MSFSINDIEKLLRSFAIPYEKEGQNNEYDGFCSFRKCENGGIYFVVEDILPPQKICNSLFICDRKRPDLLPDGNATITVKNAQNTYYKLMNSYCKQERKPMIHSTAILHNNAIIQNHVEIGPYCVIGKAIIKRGVCLRSHVAIYDNSIIEEDVRIESFTCIGATGAAWSFDTESGERIIQPQLGGVLIGKNSFIGSNITIVRGSVNENTEIGENCVIAHGTKIGHGCRIGSYTHFANNVTIAGNVDIGEFGFIGAGAVLRPQISLAQGTIVAAGAVVVKSVFEADCLLIGVPARIEKYDRDRMVGIPTSYIQKRRINNGE